MGIGSSKKIRLKLGAVLHILAATVHLLRGEKFLGCAASMTLLVGEDCASWIVQRKRTRTVLNRQHKPAILTKSFTTP